MYGTKYILGFSNNLNELYEVYFDFLNFSGTPRNILCNEGGLVLRCTNGDENKFEPILGTECLIGLVVGKTEIDGKVLDTTDIDITEFIAVNDNEIKITVYKDQVYTRSIFQGYVVVEDNSQPFLDPPFTLSIRALDTLGLLKNIPLTDTTGKPITGALSIINWIAQILFYTGQELNIKGYFNFYNDLFLPTESPLFETAIDGITFQSASANFTDTNPADAVSRLGVDDCYTALEKICRNFRCRLFQEDGCWHFVSLYEYLNPAGYRYFEWKVTDPVDGIVGISKVGSESNVSYNINIGKNEIIHPVQDDGVLYLKLATKWIELTYTYDQSQNKICNQNLSLGTRDASFDRTLSSTIVDPTILPVVDLVTQGYDLYCYTHGDSPRTPEVDKVPNVLPANAPTKRAYISEILDPLGYLYDRIMVIENVVVGNNNTWVKAGQFLIDSGDRLKITFDFRTKDVQPPSSILAYFPVAVAILTGDDGSLWGLVSDEDFSGGILPQSNSADPLNPGNNVWVPVDATYRHQFNDHQSTPMITWGGQEQPSNQWSNVGAGISRPVTAPTSGKVDFYFIGCIDIDTNEVWNKNMSVTLTPYLQGSFTQLKGDYNYSASNNNIKQTENDAIEISDSPKRYFKGALLNQDGQGVTPTKWHRIGETEMLRFTQIMEIIMFNHLSRMLQKFEGTLRGITYVNNADLSDTRPNGFLNTYLFVDSNTPDKKFMLTSFEKDMCKGTWRGVFVETLKDKNDTGWNLPDDYQFSYLFN